MKPLVKKHLLAGCRLTSDQVYDNMMRVMRRAKLTVLMASAMPMMRLVTMKIMSWSYKRRNLLIYWSQRA